jgi:DNA polymerase III subunit epsilon
MKLTLHKPLCVFDLETTGVQITKDRIVQIAIIKIHPDGSELEYNQIVNPEMEIPQEICEIHGITNEMAKKAPTLKELAPAIMAFIGDADLAGFNSNKFDIPVLVEELIRVGVDADFSNKAFVDVQNIFHKMEQRTLSAACLFYTGKPMENAHNALFDTRVTWEVLKAQIERYDNLEGDVTFLSDFSRHSNFEMVDYAGRLAKNENGETIYNFGKHKGKTILQVNQSEPGYYGWMLEADFTNHTKLCLRKEMDKIKLEKEQKKEQDLSDKLNSLTNKFNTK